MPKDELAPQPVTDLLEAGLKEWQAAQDYWSGEEQTRKETLRTIEPAAINRIERKPLVTIYNTNRGMGSIKERIITVFSPIFSAI